MFLKQEILILKCSEKKPLAIWVKFSEFNTDHDSHGSKAGLNSIVPPFHHSIHRKCFIQNCSEVLFALEIHILIMLLSSLRSANSHIENSFVSARRQTYS